MGGEKGVRRGRVFAVGVAVDRGYFGEGCGGVGVVWGGVAAFEGFFWGGGPPVSRVCVGVWAMGLPVYVVLLLFFLSCHAWSTGVFCFCGDSCGGLWGVKFWRGGFFAQTVLWEVCECGASNYGRPEAQRRPRTTKKTHIF